MRVKRKIGIWVKLAALAMLLAGAAFGSSVIFDRQLGEIVFYAFAPLLLLLAIFFVAVIVRVRVFGRLPSDLGRLSKVDARLSPVVLRPARFWAIFKLGILGAVVILGAGSVISGIAGAGIRHGVEGFVYLTLLMMFGNLIVGTIVNLDLVKKVRSSTN